MSPEPTALDLELRAEDGLELGATLREPAGEPACAVLVNPALGVRRRYYGRFAAFLAERGAAVLTYDQRGIGDSRPASLRGFEARMTDWGRLDTEAALRALVERFPGVPLRVVGHSAGGQLLGLAPTAGRVDRALFVACQSAWKGHWDGLRYLWIASVWHVAVPVATALIGKLPGSLTGGEAIPAGVAREWARWGRHPDYLLSEGGSERRRAYAQLRLRIRSLAIDDDAYAPLRAVESLLTFYGGAGSELRRVAPADAGVRSLGHFGFFRSETGGSLWPEAADWLLSAE